MSIEIVDTFQNSMRDATLSTGACAPSPLVVYARRSHSPRNVSTGLGISIEHGALDGGQTLEEQVDRERQHDEDLRRPSADDALE
jgi:hypothetical protein